MKYRTFGFALLSLVATAAIPLQADDRDDRFRADLRPFNEVPAVSSVARGSFRLTIDSSTQLSYRLSWENLEGTVTQAHIHFGDKHTIGGISIWLCSNLASPPTPPNTQACPTTAEATVTGTIVAANVVGPSGQGIDAGELAEIVKAIRRGSAYANVHSTKFQPGEIRGEIVESRGRDHD